VGLCFPMNLVRNWMFLPALASRPQMFPGHWRRTKNKGIRCSACKGTKYNCKCDKSANMVARVQRTPTRSHWTLVSQTGLCFFLVLSCFSLFKPNLVQAPEAHKGVGCQTDSCICVAGKRVQQIDRITVSFSGHICSRFASITELNTIHEREASVP
jgi:hypothetical protein